MNNDDNSSTTIETRAVLGGAYRERDPRSFLNHAVEVKGGSDVAVLCNRVQLDNIADIYALTADERAKGPTCKTCARKLAKRGG